MKKKRKKI